MSENNNNEGEFYFPLKREQLLEVSTDSRFVLNNEMILDDVSEESLLNDLKYVIDEIKNDFTLIYNKENFGTIYKILNLYLKNSRNYKINVITNLSKIFDNFSRNFENFFDKKIEYISSHSDRYRNVFKLYIFMIDWLVENILNDFKNQTKEIKNIRRKIKNNLDLNLKISKKNKNKKQTKKKENAANALCNSDEEIKIKNDNIDIKEFNSTIESKMIIIMKAINILSNCDIKNIFRNKIIDDEIISNLITINFHFLEISINIKTKNNNEFIFETLQKIITNFQSNTNIQIILIKLTTKIVNLIYSQESLVNSLSSFIVFIIKKNNENNLNKMAMDIINEISKTVFEDKNLDSQGIKNVGKFLIILSEKCSKTIYNNITILLQLFDSESYVIRNALVEVISNIIINLLCNLDEIKEVEVRNNYLKAKENFLEILFKRIYDKNGFCRSKVLATFERLCENNTINIPTYFKLLKNASGRLYDEKSIVRKRAISLIGKIITMYSIIFKCDKFLNKNEIQDLINESRKKIDEKENRKTFLENDTKINPINENVNNEEKNKLNEEINKEDMIIDFFQNYILVLENIDKVVPSITELLSSKNQTDVLESIDLFIVLHKLRIQSSEKGIRKMLVLIMKSEIPIKKKVIEAFKIIYFDKNLSYEIQAAYLITFCNQLNFSEFTCINELFKYLIEEDAIDKQVFKEIWKIMLKITNQDYIKSIKASEINELRDQIKLIENESLTALKIINIASEYDSTILTNFGELYIKMINAVLCQKNKLNWTFLQHSFHGLCKIYPLKKDNTENCFVRIAKAIIKNYGKIDNDWFLVIKEMIDTIFNVMNEPEKICEYLIIKLSKYLFMNNNEMMDIDIQDKFKTQNIFSQNMTDMSQSQDGLEIINTGGITPMQLTQLIFVVGHVALNMIIYSEKMEQKIKKKFLGGNKKKTPNKNNQSNISGLSSSSKKKKSVISDIEEVNGGQEAQADYNIGLIHNIIDEDILKKNLIAMYVPLIVGIAKKSLTCSNKEMDKNKLLYKVAILSLCKLMCINSKFCSENLDFIFEVIENDNICSDLKLNICIAIGDFINRFPNVFSKYIDKFFMNLHSSNKEVVHYTLIVISHLVLNDMLKLKGEIVDICMLLNTDSDNIKNNVKIFLNEINGKGSNVIYNMIPQALSKLNTDYKNISYDSYKQITKILMSYVDKDKYIEEIANKMINRLKATDELNEWKKTTYILSLMNFNSEKGMLNFLEAYSEINNKPDDNEDVKENLRNLLLKFKKINNLSLNSKEILEKNENKILNGEKIVINKNKSKNASNNNSKSNSNNSSRSNSKTRSPIKKNLVKRRFKQINEIKEDDEENEESRHKTRQTKTKTIIRKNKKKGRKKKNVESEEDEEYS